MNDRRTTTRRARETAAILAIGLACGCAPGETQKALPPPAGGEQSLEAGARASDPADLVPYGRMPFEGVLTGGQPAPAQLERLAELGYRSVINMRVPDEEGSTDPAAVAALGMSYASIPIAGESDINEEVARTLAAAMEEAGGPVLVHCASGNRIGAILGYKAWKLDGKTPEEALAIARDAGITRLEPHLRTLMGLDAGGPE